MYTFEHFSNDDSGSTSMVLNTDDITWPELVGKFQDFLAGVGFIFPGKTEFDMAEILDYEHEKIRDYGFDLRQEGEVAKSAAKQL